VDIPLHPVVMMRMVHPHFGYLNLIPHEPHFKYTHQQLFTLLEEFTVASRIRDQGYTLHSSELLSFIFWKILTQGQPRVNTQSFLDLLKVFKFNALTPENYRQSLGYSLHEGEIIEKDQGVRFDVFRQIFLDRDL
jgi:hypothetical protein